MRNTLFTLSWAVMALASIGCASSSQVERGPAGTRAFYVKVESSHPGTKVEANGEFIGETPTEMKIWGDEDGTFHNFGSYQFVVKALPSQPGQYEQTKVFRTGGWFTPEDLIPSRIYFDMNLAPPPVHIQTQGQPQPQPVQSTVVTINQQQAVDSPKANQVNINRGNGEKIKVKVVLAGGDILRMEDESLWQVAPDDKGRSALWASQDEVTFIAGGNVEYPFRLLKDEGVVRARLLSEK